MLAIMKYPSKIQARFEETINIIKNNIKHYLLLNLGLFLIWIGLFVIAFGFLFIFLIFSGLFNKFSNFNTNSLYFTNYNTKIILILFIIIILIILFLLWILKATNFIGNFYYTKALDSGEKVDLKKIFLLSYKKLQFKALIDLWYFLIFFGLFLSYILGILFSYLLYILFGKSNLIMIALLIIITILFVYLLVRIFIKYYFANLYCFDTEKFSIKNFNDSTKIVKNKKIEVALNLLLVGILTYVFSSILGLFTDKIIPFYFINNINNTKDYSVLLSNLTNISFIICIITYIIIKYLIYLLTSIFDFVYIYIYYKYLINKRRNNRDILK